MQFVVGVAVQSEVDECLLRCMATPGGHETNIGINTSRMSVYRSVGISFFLVVLLPGPPHLPSSVPELAGRSWSCYTAWILSASCLIS